MQFSLFQSQILTATQGHFHFQNRRKGPYVTLSLGSKSYLVNARMRRTFGAVQSTLASAVHSGTGTLRPAIAPGFIAHASIRLCSFSSGPVDLGPRYQSWANKTFSVLGPASHKVVWTMSAMGPRPNRPFGTRRWYISRK